jgi:hypothetical protein
VSGQDGRTGEDMAVTGRVGAERVGFGIAVLGGPTTVVDLAGSRLVVDPTFVHRGTRAT